ncbi:putative ABC transporter [Emiliania huxleyi CCMP1516]|uniref:ABC transporter domain-containing protein n=2 Tax=Emiliania huxleyi TaxID=2903 RepID=A0A0D3IS87_EMIH1|nr:putative ABC transporter [Emiliania huxleyi CCMP1516]EOD14122.1 putative ABC transporter [Emiliania huxleyi CCMP1516]|eukprot:XP_005766551.1 putative ABC transporter [Emiliania huxleyi CCMP1516]
MKPSADLNLPTAMCRNWAIAFVTGFAKGLIIMIFGAIFECGACELRPGAIFEFGMWRVRTSDAALPGAPEASSDPHECAGSLDLSGSDAATDASKASAAAAAYFKRVDRPSLLDPTSDKGGTLPSVTGAIEVVDVVFAYPTRPDFTICHGYSLSIGAGQTVALCGPPGSGKSTLVALLERFYDPQGGAITLDGVDIRTLNLRWLRSQLGLVGQEPVLFEGTVAENIGYGKEGASQDEIEEAARAANAHGFVMDSLPDGYATQPAVLLLDEATSALDNESERVVQAALDSIVSQHKRTTVTIAHRLSTIKNADKIAVLRKGAVIEQGTHEELLELGGTYLALWEAQQ